MNLRIARLPALTTALFAAGLAYASPAAAQSAREDDEPPARDAAEAPKPDLPPPSARWNVAVTGLGMSAAWYGAALFSSLAWSNGKWESDMRIPVAGPWMAMHNLKCGPGERGCGIGLVVVRDVLAGLDGVGQVGGLFVALESLFLPVRKTDHAHRAEPKHAWVRPVPFVVGTDTIGLGFVGEL